MQVSVDWSVAVRLLTAKWLVLPDVSGLTFGTNGFYLDFEASGNLGNDANGGTDLTEVNLAATDQSTDTCTNNFACLLYTSPSPRD